MFVEVDGKGRYNQHIRWSQLASKADGDLTIHETIEVPDPNGGGKQTIRQTQKSKQVIETPAK